MFFKSGEVTVLSYNLVSINSAIQKHDLLGFIQSTNCDILFFQETQIRDYHEDNIKRLFQDIGYPYSLFNNGEFGVACFMKTKPLSWESMNDGRSIKVYFTDLTIVNVYAKNAGQNLKNIDKKIEWNKKLESMIGPNTLLCGDLNVVNEDIDIWMTDQKSLQKTTKQPGYSPIERIAFREMIQNFGFIDIFRAKYPQKREYSYYDYKQLHNKEYFENKSKKGWRIDYFLLTKDVDIPLKYLDVKHIKHKGSDHIPLVLTYRRSYSFNQSLITVKYKELNGDGFRIRLYYQTHKHAITKQKLNEESQETGIPKDILKKEKPLYKMFEYADYYNHTIYIAYQNAEKSYQFMSFLNKEEFESYYQKAEYKNYYQIIRENSLCDLYFDLDKVDTKGFKSFISLLLKTFEVKDILIKQSQKGYHIICNKQFKNNEVMKVFVLNLIKNTKYESLVDLKVYTKNRLMRLLYSSKYGKDDPFIPINILGQKIDITDIRASDYFIA